MKARHKIAFVHTNMRLAGYIPSLDSHLYDCMEAVFSVSEEVGRIFAEMYPAHAGKVSLFHNVTDVAGIREGARKGAGFTDAYGGARLLTIGRLQPYKAYDVAIPALAELLRRGVDARWYVLGEGPERQNLEKLIREQGLTDRFFLLGDVENPYPYIA
ncbi:MAG: glycosyltransferase, partial [Oscillospiraceae bacterium]